MNLLHIRFLLDRFQPRDKRENKCHITEREGEERRLALFQKVCASLQVHVEVPAALSSVSAAAKPLKVLIAGVRSAVGIRWVVGPNERNECPIPILRFEKY